MPLDGFFRALGSDGATFRAFVEQLPAGISFHDAAGRSLFHNTAFANILGGLPPSVQDLPTLSSRLARACAGEVVAPSDIELPTSGATPRRVRVSALPVRDGGALLILQNAAGAPGGADVEAGQAETLGVVGHDLRNPLAAIRMTAQLLAKPNDMPNDRRVTLIQRILASTGRLDALVKTLVDYARNRAGAVIRLDCAPMDLGELTRTVVDEQIASFPNRTVQLEVSGDLKGRWDSARLGQAIGNLVNNALRHGRSGGTVRVNADGAGADRVSLSIHNDGPEIPVDVLPRLFHPFSVGARVEGTPRRSIGLGLFIAKELVAAHGGSVSCRSSAEAGTDFVIDLPRVTEVAPGVTPT